MKQSGKSIVNMILCHSICVWLKSYLNLLLLSCSSHSARPVRGGGGWAKSHVLYDVSALSVCSLTSPWGKLYFYSVRPPHTRTCTGFSSNPCSCRELLVDVILNLYCIQSHCKLIFFLTSVWHQSGVMYLWLSLAVLHHGCLWQRVSTTLWSHCW